MNINRTDLWYIDAKSANTLSILFPQGQWWNLEVNYTSNPATVDPPKFENLRIHRSTDKIHPGASEEKFDSLAFFPLLKKEEKLDPWGHYAPYGQLFPMSMKLYV